LTECTCKESSCLCKAVRYTDEITEESYLREAWVIQEKCFICQNFLTQISFSNKSEVEVVISFNSNRDKEIYERMITT
jgi:hypothetical protein